MGNYSNSGEERREREQGYNGICNREEEEEEDKEEEEEEEEKGEAQYVDSSKKEEEEEEEGGVREGVRFSAMGWQKRKWKIIDGSIPRQKESRSNPPPYFGSHRGGGETSRRGGDVVGGGGGGGEEGRGRGGGGRRGGGGGARGSYHTQGVRDDRVCDEAVPLLTQPWNIPKYSSDGSG